MNHAVRAGITGFIVAAVINSITPYNLYFFPELILSIIVIYVYGLKELKDGLLAAFITYIFSDWFISTLYLTLLFYSGESINLTVDPRMIFIQAVTAPTALLAAYAGSQLARTKPTTETAPPPPPPIQPV